jgi:hypothetical protein
MRAKRLLCWPVVPLSERPHFQQPLLPRSRRDDDRDLCHGELGVLFARLIATTLDSAIACSRHVCGETQQAFHCRLLIISSQLFAINASDLRHAQSPTAGTR